MQKRRTATLVVAVLLVCSALALWWLRPHGTMQASAPSPSTSGPPVTATAPTPAPSASAELSSEDAGGEAEGADAGSVAVRPKTATATHAETSESEPSATPTASSTAAFELPDAGGGADAAAVLASSEQKPNKPEIGTLSAAFHDRVGVTFRLVGVSCTLDGVSVYSRTGALGRDFALFSQTVPVGIHRLSVVASYRGASGGVFSYAEGYHFEVRNGAKVALNADQSTRVSVLVRESGGPTTPMEQRLQMGMSVK